MLRFSLYSLFLLAILTGCNNQQAASSSRSGTEGTPAPPLIQYTVINTYPHDTAYFTEGLEFHHGVLYESSGGNLTESPYPSAVGIVNFKTGHNDTKLTIDRARYFGEGISFFGKHLYELTWRSGTGFIYDTADFKKIREFRIPAKEGWGLTHDDKYLYMSDGSSHIYVLQPDSLTIVRTIDVTDNSGPVSNINELEYVNGVIYANQWLSNYILRIDPATGNVTGKLDLTSIRNEMDAKYSDLHELNGIAYDKSKNSFIITGKKWPRMYEIRLQ